MPGGVNSPVRAFKAVGGTPPFIKKAQGPFLWDEDGNKFIDFVGSWGTAILGHAHPQVLAAVSESLQNGLSFGAPCEIETKLAKAIAKSVPVAEKVRLVSSGTEACLSAIRLARGFTGRDKIIKFAGNYHGHGDMLLSKAGSGVATFGLPDSPGVPKGAAADTLTADYNSLASVEALFKENSDSIAAVILEPIAGNTGFIRGEPDFLQGLRDLCSQNGALLIFDEVMTGFRVALGGATQVSGIKPDLITLGKVIGGGMPLAAYAGSQKIMSQIAPEGPIYQAGTLSGNPVAVTCGLATLELISQNGFHDALEKKSAKLVKGLLEIAKKYDLPLQGDYQGGMFGVFFSSDPVKDYQGAKDADVEKFNAFHRKMLELGIYLAPSAFEAGFISSEHTEAHLDQTLECAEKVIKEIQG